MLPKDADIIRFIADAMTIRLKPSDMGEIRFYMHSRTRICITKFDTLLPEVWISNKNTMLERFGFVTVQDLANWLVASGAKQIKKPKPYRAPLPIYD